jgi:hypothetical protein
MRLRKASSPSPCQEKALRCSGRAEPEADSGSARFSCFPRSGIRPRICRRPSQNLGRAISGLGLGFGLEGIKSPLAELGSPAADAGEGFFYTLFFIDPKEHRVALFMAPLDPTGGLTLARQAHELAYQTMRDSGVGWGLFISKFDGYMILIKQVQPIYSVVPAREFRNGYDWAGN